MNKIISEAFSIICRNEDVFEFTQEHGLHGVIVFDAEDLEGNWFNPKFLHSLGYERDQAILNWKDIVTPAGANKIKKILDSPGYSGEILSGTIEFSHSEDFLVLMEYKALLVKDETSDERKLVIAVKKISDDAHLESDLDLNFQKEQLFLSICDTIEVGIVACDKHGKLTLFNKAAKEWHGLPLKHMPQSEYASHYQLYEPDGVTIFKTEDIPLLTVLTEGVIRKREMLIKPNNGKNSHITITGARLYDEDGAVNGAVVALHNVSKIKQAENKLKVSEQLFRGTFENAADGMAILDSTGQWVEVNERLCEITGYSQNELKRLNNKDITHPDDLASDIELWEELITGERENYQVEKRYIHKKGKIIDIILSVSVVRNENSQPLHFVTQITDISELKTAQKEIGRILTITKDQNQRLTNFAHIVSHNLRSHSGNMEMLLDIFTDEHPEQRDNEVVAMLNTASGNLKETIAHLNEVALINTSVSNEMLTINLKKSVIKTLGSVNALVQKSNIQIINDIPEELEVISLPAYLESIILNFATNAIKYRSAKRRPFLRFGAVKVKGYIELRIEDNGIGIDLNKHGTKLFGMYKTFHKHEDARGIGLFITKNQIEAIGGKVEVESQVDKGTTFTIFFKHEKI